MDQAIEGLSTLAHVHIDTIKRILDGRTRNPQAAKLRAIAGQLGVPELWLRRGQEELSFAGRRIPPRQTQRTAERTPDVEAPTSDVLTTVLAEIDRLPNGAAKVRAFRSAVAAMIKSAVKDGEVLSAGYDALAHLDAWLAAARRRGKAEARPER